MAKLTKSRGRKPLAEGEVTFSGTSGFDGRKFGLSIKREDGNYDRPTYFSVDLDEREAMRFVGLVVGSLTHEPWDKGFYSPDRRSIVEQLRALASKLEVEGNLQRMGLTG